MTNALRHPAFRALWLAQSVSAIGDRMLTVTLALFVIDLTGSAAQLGLVLAAYEIPLVAFVVFGGVWADRLPRKLVMVASDLVRFLCHGAIAVLVFTAAIEVWQLVAILAVSGSATAFFRPAFGGLLPQTVPEEELQAANSISGLSNNVAELAGPALATALVLGLGAGAAFAFDALTFVVSAACLWRLRPRPRGEVVARGTFLEDLRAGWGAVRSRVWVWASIAGFCVALLVALAPWFVLGPIVAREAYGSAAVFGWTSAALGGGTVLGALIGLRWRPRRPLRAGLALVLLWPVSQVLFAAGLPLALVLPAWIVAGAGLSLFEVWWITTLAERIPPHLLSRVTSYDYLGSLALLPVGYILAGPAAAAIGASTVLLAGSVIGAVALAAALLPGETRRLGWPERPDSPVVPLAEPRPGVAAP